MDELVQERPAPIEHPLVVRAGEIACGCGGKGEERLAEDDVDGAIT